MSRLFATTRRDVAGRLPLGQELLIRAGYMRPTGGGVLVQLPAGARLHELVVHRLADTLPEDAHLLHLPSHGERPGMPTLPASLIELVNQEVRTYRQLPLTLYRLFHLETQEGNAQVGLLAPRAPLILEVYHLDADGETARERYRARWEQVSEALMELGIQGSLITPDDGGVPDEDRAHSFAIPLPVGPDILLRCPTCDQAFPPRLAPFRRPEPPEEQPSPLTKVKTPGTNTIGKLATFLNIPRSRTAKVVFYTACQPHGDGEEEVLVVVLVRGDMDVSEVKVRRAIGARSLRPATEEEIRAAGGVPGFASPVGLRSVGVVVVADELIVRSPNLVAGANEPDAHYLNVNVGRDYMPDVVADIALAPPKAPCVACGTPLERMPVVVAGWSLGFGAGGTWGQRTTFTADDGTRRPIWFSLFRLDISRLVGTLAEVHHDGQGLRWPPGLAPYDVHLVRLGRGAELVKVADHLYASLREAHFHVLYDDRDVGAGAKFTDADLIGAPIQVTVAPRALRQGGVEIKVRATGERRVIAMKDVVGAVRAHMA